MARKPTDKQLFKMKNEWLGQFYEEVKPRDFYRAVFPEGSFEREGHPEDEKCKKILGIVAGVVGIISVIVGVALKMNNNAIAIIGGVDGPTSVFVAGKLNSVLVSILLIAIGVVMLIVAIIFYFLKKK